MGIGRSAVPILDAVDVRLAVHVFFVHTFHQGPESKRVHILLPGDVELRPFRSAVAAGVAAVMTAHVLYPAWVQAETATTVALIPGAVYRRLFESESAIQNLTGSTHADTLTSGAGRRIFSNFPLSLIFFLIFLSLN